VNEALDWKVPFPAGVAVPTVVPPLVQVAGAVDCGPKTLNVMGAVAFAPELDARVAAIDAAGTAVPTVPVAGALTVSVGLALPTAKVCATGVAGFQFALPGCVAFTMQVPTAMKPNVAPFVPPDAQTVGLPVPNVTARPEPAVALAMYGAPAAVAPGGVVDVKAIV